MTTCFVAKIQHVVYDRDKTSTKNESDGENILMGVCVDIRAGTCVVLAISRVDSPARPFVVEGPPKWRNGVEPLHPMRPFRQVAVAAAPVEVEAAQE